MTFAVPLFLIASLAAAIPVVLHMINRQRAKDLPFSTLRFLRVSAQKTRRRKQVNDVLLMLLRMSALVLVALALSKPALTNLRMLFGGANTAVAIVLDNSASMGVVDNGRMRFETALAAANQVLEQLKDGDQVALFLTGGKAFPELGKLDRTHESTRQILGQLRQPSFERGDVAAKVLDARRTVAKSDLSNKQIFVISDFQQNGWDSLKQKTESKPGDAKGGDGKPADSAKNASVTDSDIPLVLIDVNRQPKPNVAVVNVAIEAAVPVAGLPIKATAELVNGAAVQQTRTVELYIDGNKEAASPALTIPEGGNYKHDFIFTFKGGGLHKGEVRLVGEDGCKLDDRFFFTMEVDQGMPVAVVKKGRHEITYLEDSYYVERALGAGKSGNWAIKLTSLTADQLPGEPLANYKMIYCVNLPAPDDATAEKLRTYVEQGGNVMWIAGDNVEPEAYNKMNSQARSQLLPLPLLDVRSPAQGEDRDSWHIGFLDKKHRALASLIEPASLYQSVLVYKFIRQDPGKAGDAWVLARLDDGEPLFTMRKVGRGSVLFFGATGHREWTNFPVRPLFLPLVARLTFDLCGAEQARYQTTSGAPLVLQFDNQVRPSGVEVVPPSGETVRLDVKDDQGKGAAFRFAETHDIGIYMMRFLQAVNQKQTAFAVNVDGDEADPAKIKPEQLKELFGDEPLVWAENPEDLSGTFEWLRQGKSMWGLLLVLVLVVLVFETLISNILTPKQEAEDPALAKLPPGLRRLAKEAKAKNRPKPGTAQPAAT